MDVGKIVRVLIGLTNETLTEAEYQQFFEIADKYGINPDSEIGALIDMFQILLRYQLNVDNVVEVLAVIAIAVVGLAFMWWGVRKITSALMKAFRKGKISI